MARRSSARRRTSGRERSDSIEQLPWREVRNPFPPLEVLSQDQLEHIHTASLTILEELGMEVMGEDARRIYREAGADVDDSTMRVRFDRDMIMEQMAKVPAEFTLHSRVSVRDVTLGGNRIVTTAVSSPPNVADLDNGRRSGNFEDFQNLVRVAASLNCIHFLGGYPVEPIDLPVPTRHLDCYMTFITQTDRVWRTYALGAERSRDGIIMNKIARGISDEEMIDKPGIITLINTNSPLRLDEPMSQGLIEMATHGQAVSITPFTLLGAMAPTTLAGALAQQNAEALAAISLIQLVRPGNPSVYGGFTSNVDMKSGAPAFGTPEYVKATLAGGQLARKYRIPFRTSNVNASNAVDAQAAYETGMSLWAAFMGHGNFIHHGAGWLEGGLVASFEKMIVDAEMIQGMFETMQPITVNDEEIGIEAMRDVGPGGHFFGTQHTLDRYENAFYAPMLSDWRNFETWEEAGSPDAATRANKIWKQILADFEEPPLDPAIREELEAFVAQRKAEGGVHDN
ncbi:MAG: methyltransferase [Rhodospirillaceae bacterium]|nr:methyltransferase [Rhodospirillaceae bacterium]|tara:strand:+ start:684 stop:2219 length:1536 start_codon:yes stop_codon:yes gene_type:complete